MKIDKEEIYNKYIQWVEQVAEHLDWKTHFTPKEIVYKICQIIEDEFKRD